MRLLPHLERVLHFLFSAMRPTCLVYHGPLTLRSLTSTIAPPTRLHYTAVIKLVPLFCVCLPQVAEYVDRAVNIAVGLKKQYPKLKEFREALNKEVRSRPPCAGTIVHSKFSTFPSHNNLNCSKVFSTPYQLRAAASTCILRIPVSRCCAKY